MRILQEEIKAEAKLTHPAERLDKDALIGRHRGWLMKAGQITAWGRMFNHRGNDEEHEDLRTEMRLMDRVGGRQGKELSADLGGAGVAKPRREEMRGELAELADAAQRLAAALEGRSLLEAELQQLLAERLPGLAPVWRSALQHAHLQGRVQLTAGVASARQDPGPRWRRARTPAAGAAAAGCIAARPAGRAAPAAAPTARRASRSGAAAPARCCCAAAARAPCRRMPEAARPRAWPPPGPCWTGGG